VNSNLLFQPPTITETDLREAAVLLQIEEHSLFASNRLQVATGMQSIDVTACPGSGKTTLLVAKLAMLASLWKHSTRGICVLSHTNVARTEIETHLGNTASGRSLFGYPHYVGTIHGFVNEFLALPWLRSQGYPIKLIDTDQVLRRRWWRLGRMSPKTQYSLEKNGYNQNVLTIKSADYGVGSLRSGKGKLGVETQTYKDIVHVCRLSTTRGYFCYDEMFIWANELLDKIGGVEDALRYRFPLVFIDEAQDNSEQQAAILNRVFLEGDSTVRCQRFGDENQAIFDSLQSVAAKTNPFPNPALAIELSNSHRFGQSIADIADPLAAVPLSDGLKGNGPKCVLSSGRAQGPHTVFLVDQHTTKNVLDAFGNLLVRTFSQEEISNGSFFAVGQVHHPPEEELAHKHPHHLGHYWPDYNATLTRSEPGTFNQYVSFGVNKAKSKGECSFAVEKIAQGIIRLASEGNNSLSVRRYCHRQVLELLERSDTVKDKYQHLILAVAVEREELTKESWLNCWRRTVLEIAEAIAQARLSGPIVDAFLNWKEEPASALADSTDRSLIKDNTYQYPQSEPQVNIQLGSIHSVKGQTHTATLVLETFWKSHNLERLAPWLFGEKVGCGTAESGDQMKRMKLHYVAVTRPTHLLCLAVKRHTLEDRGGGLDRKKIQTLKSRGWSINDLTIQLPLFTS
jgi:DNA helicase II / ATP-dependent DNA helicase PcrA